jgi:chromosomal replication initiator protein
LAQSVGHAVCDSFLRSAEVLSFDGETLLLGVPNQFARDWLEEKHLPAINACLSEFVEKPLHVRLQVMERPTTTPLVMTPPLSAAEPARESFGSSSLNPKYTFDNFVVADCNRFAHAAAQQVSKSPGKSYNPLFIHSKVGLGKTHLLQAIGHAVMVHNPTAQVVYISAESFVNQIIAAMRDNRTAEFRRRYRNVDVWLVDDVQFIAAIEGPASEEEFFHTFNTLYETNKQVIIASDAPPRHLQLMNDRLRSRLEMGIVADLRCPDVETRIAILDKKAQAEGVELSRDILAYVAEKIESNIRVLEGALLKICAYLSLSDEELTLAVVEEIIADYSTASSRQRTSVSDIAELVAERMGCNLEHMLGPKRNQEIVWPRQVAIYLAREETNTSLAGIGEFFGGRDHSTVLYAYNKVSERVENDEPTLWLINDLKNSLQAP